MKVASYPLLSHKLLQGKGLTPQPFVTMEVQPKPLKPRDEYLRQVLNLYLEAPETPHRVRRSDRVLAINFYQQRITLVNLRYTIAIVSLRRARRDPRLPSLDPIASPVYLRPTVEDLQHHPVDRGYALYVQASYRALLQDVAKTAADRQNAAVLGRR